MYVNKPRNAPKLEQIKTIIAKLLFSSLLILFIFSFLFLKLYHEEIGIKNNFYIKTLNYFFNSSFSPNKTPKPIAIVIVFAINNKTVKNFFITSSPLSRIIDFCSW